MSYQLRPTQPSQQQQEGGYDAYSDAYGQAQAHGYGHGQQPYTQPQQPNMMQHSLPSSPGPHPVSRTATMYGQDGLARTYTWVANQPPLMSPPPPAKTPFSEWTTGGTESTFDRRTLGVYSPSMPPRPPKRDPRICGIRRNAFFAVLAVGIFLFVVAIAAGLGIGLGTRKNSSDAAAVDASVTSSSSSFSSSAPATPTTPTPTTSTTPTSTKVSPTPSFTGTLVQGAIICPSNNNSVYVSRGSSKPFNIECGHDYNSNGGAKDIKHMYASSMTECIDACGQQAGCVGAGWGNYKGSTECWLKSELGKPNDSKLWYFAQLQNHSLAG
ncbi:hypothetical protein F5Y04DRAFT_125779 [Hypomontagnella monticulosa]|nr:hypothetical protein F5Y04DRAFT_125779 [Hypomontagnella monticulosa]